MESLRTSLMSKVGHFSPWPGKVSLANRKAELEDNNDENYDDYNYDDDLMLEMPNYSFKIYKCNYFIIHVFVN